MIAEDVQRRIWLIGLTGAIILGMLFLVWAVFLNRGTILIHSKAPFTLQISGLRTESCAVDDCSTVVAPGDYNITVQKQGYKPLTKSITVPLGHPYEDNISLQFIPVVTATGLPADQVFLPEMQLTTAQLQQLGINDTTQIFFDNAHKLLCYIVRNPSNFRQTLYMAAIDDTGKVGTPQIVTSFLRDIQDAVASPDTAGDKVAVIDRAPDQATLYMVDLQGKNRAALFSYAVIRGMRWLADSNDFIFQAREKGDTSESLYLYRWEDGKTVKLDLKTPLDDVAVMNKDRIFAVTDQLIPAPGNGATSLNDLQGQLVPLGENQSTAEINQAIVSAAAAGTDTASLETGIIPPTPSATPVYAFVDYSLIANQARLITAITSDPFPTKIKISSDGKQLFFLQGDKVFQLSFEE